MMKLRFVVVGLFLLVLLSCVNRQVRIKLGFVHPPAGLHFGLLYLDDPIDLRKEPNIVGVIKDADGERINKYYIAEQGVLSKKVKYFTLQTVSRTGLKLVEKREDKPVLSVTINDFMITNTGLIDKILKSSNYGVLIFNIDILFQLKKDDVVLWRYNFKMSEKIPTSSKSDPVEFERIIQKALTKMYSELTAEVISQSFLSHIRN